MLTASAIIQATTTATLTVDGVVEAAETAVETSRALDGV
jgi:hypothetical protein